MEICGDEEWVKEYGDIVWPPEEVMITPADRGHMNKGVGLSGDQGQWDDPGGLSDGRQWSRFSHR